METHPSGPGQLLSPSPLQADLNRTGRLSNLGWFSKIQMLQPAHLHMAQEGSLSLPQLCLQTTDHPGRDEASSAASTQVLQHFKPTLKSVLLVSSAKRYFSRGGENSPAEAYGVIKSRINIAYKLSIFLLYDPLILQALKFISPLRSSPQAGEISS